MSFKEKILAICAFAVIAWGLAKEWKTIKDDAAVAQAMADALAAKAEYDAENPA